MKKTFAWIALCLVTLVAVAVVCIVTLPHIRPFRQYALHIVESKLRSSLGLDVQVQDFALSPLHLTLDAYGIVVKGAAPYPEPPLLTVDHLRAGVGIISLLHREWYLRELTVDHPVAHVFFDRDGKNNLPQAKGHSQSHKSIFQLGVRHARLSRGEVFYNNRQSSLEADLHDLEFRAGFPPVEERYSGNLNYKNGHLRLQNFRPIPHQMSAAFEITPSQFILRHAELSSGSSKLELVARLENYSEPVASARYTAVFNCGELSQILNNPSIPAGTVHATGSVDYQSQPNIPMLNSIRANSDLASRELISRTADFHERLSNFEAHLALANGNATLTNMHGDVLGGTVTASANIRDIAGMAESSAHAIMRGISLRDLQSITRSSPLPGVSLAGTLNAEAAATWQKNLNDLAAKLDASITGSVSSRTAQHEKVIPVNGEIHGRYVAANGEISLRQSGIHLPQTTLDLNGTVSRHSSLHVIFQSKNIRELEGLAVMVHPPLQNQLGQQGIAGTVSFQGDVRGSTSAPRLTGHITAADVHFRGSDWPLLHTNIDFSPSAASLQSGEIKPPQGGSIVFNASTQLTHWAFSPNLPVDLNLKANGVNIADLAGLVRPQIPVAGTLSANLAVTGTARNPSANGIVALSKGMVENEPLQSIRVHFNSQGEHVEARLNLQAPAGNAQGMVTFATKAQTYQVQLQGKGIRLERLRAIESRNLGISGILNINASGQGSIKNPQLTAEIESPAIQVRNQQLGDIALQANLENHVAKIELNAHAINTLIHANATVQTTGNYQADATINTQKIPLQPLLAAYSPAEGANLNGQTELHVTLHGPLKDKSELEVHATVPVLEINYTDKFHLAATQPIRVDMSKGVLVLQKAEIHGTGTNMQVQASVPIIGTSPASILALGTVDLQIAQLFDPDLTSSGQLRFDINSFGQRSSLDVKGQIHIVNASFTSNAAPVGLQGGNGVLTLTKDRLNISQFTGTVGGGQVQVSGGILYRPRISFDVGLKGYGMRLLYPEGMRSSLGANLTLTGTPEAASLGGQVQINQLGFTPDFDLNGFMGQFGGVEPPPSQGFAQNLQLNLSVQSPNGINLVSREVSLDGNANLTIRGTAAEPVVLGRMNLNNGDLIFMGNRYLIQGGTIDFANASETLPVLNVTASTTIQQYDIQLQFTGPADRLRTNYTSVPSLPPSDIINLLVFGKTSEESTANPIPGNLGAESLIASQISSQVTSRVEKIAGISRLSIDPVLAGNGSQQNPGARVTIQQRVTGNIFVTFSTDVTQTGNQVVEIQYNVTPRVTISGTRDQNGGLGFDARIKKTW